MKSQTIGAVCVSLFAAAAQARAQEAPPQQPPPPPLAWHPAPAYVGPSLQEIDALEAHGRHEKRIGVILIASGSAVLVAGTSLMIAGWWHHDDSCRQNYYYRGSYYYSDDGYYGGCSNRGLTLAGATTSVLGLGMLVPGIIEHVGGANDIEAARRLRRCAGVYWHPTFSPQGGGVELEMRR